MSKKAGITFPASRVKRKFKAMRISTRIGAGAPVYMAACLEYLASEVLELAGNSALQNRKKIIRPRDITLAVRNDAELDSFIGAVHIAKGGVKPFIAPQLLKKEAARKAKAISRKATKFERESGGAGSESGSVAGDDSV